jgi:hypothetical protein
VEGGECFADAGVPGSGADFPVFAGAAKSNVTEIQEIGERLVEVPSIEVGQTGVAKYTARRRGPPSQGWTTFLRNHADGIAAMDIFVVRTISFRLLFGLLIMGHGRRQILWFGVTVSRRRASVML